MNTPDNKNAPLATLRDGAVHVKLWEQRAGDNSYVNASIGRLYKDDQGMWRETRSFGATDLLKLQNLLPQAHQEMRRQQERLREQSRAPQPATPSQSPEKPAPERASSRGARRQDKSLPAQRDAAMTSAQKSRPTPPRGRIWRREPTR